MSDPYRLTLADLFETLSDWDKALSTSVLLAACRGTALLQPDVLQNQFALSAK